MTEIMSIENVYKGADVRLTPPVENSVEVVELLRQLVFRERRFLGDAGDIH